MTLGQTATTLVGCPAPEIVQAVLDVFLLGRDARRFGNEGLTVLEPPLDPELLAGEYALGDFARFSRLSYAQVVSFQEMTCRRLYAGCRCRR